MGAREEYYKNRSMERRRAYMEIVEILESGADLCVRCDGRGTDGHHKKIVNGISEPDISRPRTCSVCGGLGYVKLTQEKYNELARLVGRQK